MAPKRLQLTASSMVELAQTPLTKPPATSENRKAKTVVVLDLDETVVSSVGPEDIDILPRDVIRKAIVFGKNELYIFKRPGLCIFLRELEKLYTIIIWTAGTIDYALFVNNIILSPCLKQPIPESHIFHRKQVELSERVTRSKYHKDLLLIATMLHVDVDKMFIIDNRVDVFRQRKPGRALQIIDWIITEDIGFHDRFLESIPLIVRNLF